MKDKFKLYDPVYIRTKANDDSPFNCDEESLCIIMAIYVNQDNINDLLYEVHYIDQDCGSGEISNDFKFYKEKDLRIYLGDDEDTLFFYNDAKENYFKRLEDAKFKINYKINYKFKKKDILVIKNDNFEIPRFFIVLKRIEDTKLFNVTKNDLINKGYYYVVEEHREYKGDFISYTTHYFKEEGIELYKGNDERILNKVEEVFQYISE